MKRFAYLALMLVMPTIGFCRFTLTGKVVDGQTSEPLTGAHVILHPTYFTTITDYQGAFSFKHLKEGKYTITVSFLGYETYSNEWNITENTEVMISMQQKALLEDEIVISATRVPDASPSTFTNVEKEELHKVNLGQDLPFLLETTPSMVVSSDAGAGIGYTSLKIRGTDISRINVTINGIPLNDPESHGVYWVDLPDLSSSVESIQVQRGVGTSSNGSATFGGSINILTQSLRSEPYATINSSAGSFNTWKNTVETGTGLLDGRFTLDARLSKINSDGYIDRAFSDLKSLYLSGGYYSSNSVIRLNIFSGKEITYQAWNGIPFDSLSTNRTYNPSGEYYDTEGNIKYYDNETDNYQQDHYQLLLSQKINRNINLNLSFFHVRGFGYYENYKPNQDFSKYGLEDIVAGSDTVSETDLIRRKYLDNYFYGSVFSLNWQISKKIKSVIGGGYDYYDGDHYGTIIWAEFAPKSSPDFKWYENNGIKKQANLYTKIYFQPSQGINTFADLQLRSVDYKITGTHDNLMDISQSHDFLFFNPKAGVLFDLNQRNQSYVSVAMSHREPTRNDFRDADADNRPRREKLFNLEAGHNYTLNNLKLNANFYYMYYEDQLVLTGKINNVGNPIFINVPQSYRTGLEIIMGWKITPQLTWEANGTFSKNKIRNFTEYVDNWSPPYEQISKNLGETDISFSPSITANSILRYQPVNNLQLSLVSKYTGKQFIDNTSSDSRALDAYFVNDIRANYTLTANFIRKVSFFVLLNNIFDVEYETNAWVYRYSENNNEYNMNGYFPQAGINFLAGITLGF